MFELGEKEKEEIKGLLDESDTPNDFLNNLIAYVYAKGYEDGKIAKELEIIKSIQPPLKKSGNNNDKT